MYIDLHPKIEQRHAEWTRVMYICRQRKKDFALVFLHVLYVSRPFLELFTKTVRERSKTKKIGAK